MSRAASILFVFVVLHCNGAEWYLSPASTGGDGTISDPGKLTNALTRYGWASSLAAGDTIWLRGGTYSNAVLAANYYCWLVTWSGAAGNLVTWRSYTNEWAIIDRPWRFGEHGYHRFRDLEFVDSYKGHYTQVYGDATTFGLQWDDASGVLRNEWINCVIHDLESGWTGNAAGASVRGCIMWYVGNANRLDHLIYPGCASFTGNIHGWCSGATIELGTDGMVIANNIVWGQGRASTQADGDEPDFRLANCAATVTHNYSYRGVGSSISVNQDAGGKTVTIRTNVIVAPSTSLNGMSGTVLNVERNIFHMPAEDNYAIVAATIAGTWNFDYNAYSAKSPSVVRFETPGNLTWTEWKAAIGGDSHSTASDASNPADAVYVIPNQDEPKRAHIAVYNWTQAHNVSVDVSSVLAVGDTYILRSAQNYQGAAVLSGTLTNTTLSIPMTNLSVAPILYKYDVIYGTDPGGLMTTPPASSPEFGAFVLLGSENPSHRYHGSGDVRFSGNVQWQ